MISVMGEIEITELIYEEFFIACSERFGDFREKIIAEKDKILERNPFSKLYIHLRLSLEDMNTFTGILDELGYEYSNGSKGERILSMSSFSNFYVNLLRKINKEYYPELYKDLQIGIKENRIEFIMAFMAHIDGFDMCYVGFEEGYMLLPYNDYLKNLTQGNITFFHAFIKFQDIARFPGVGNPLNEVIDSLFNEKYKSLKIKKKGGKLNMLEVDLEYLKNEMKSIDVSKKHPHSDIIIKNYKGKPQRYLVKERKKLDGANNDI